MLSTCYYNLSKSTWTQYMHVWLHAWGPKSPTALLFCVVPHILTFNDARTPPSLLVSPSVLRDALSSASSAFLPLPAVLYAYLGFPRKG